MALNKCCLFEVRLIAHAHTPLQIQRASELLFTEFDKISNILYCRSRLPPVIPMSTNTNLLKQPRMTFIVEPSSIVSFYTILANANGISIKNQANNGNVDNIEQKVIRLNNLLKTMRNNNTNRNIEEEFPLKFRSKPINCISTVYNKVIPLDRKDLLEFNTGKAVEEMKGLPTGNMQNLEECCQKDDNVIPIASSIFNSWSLLPEDMKLWLYNYDADTIDDLTVYTSEQRDKLDVVLHGFNGFKLN